MTKQELISKIADLKKRATNKSLPASAVKALEGMIAKFEKELADLRDEPFANSGANYKEPAKEKTETTDVVVMPTGEGFEQYSANLKKYGIKKVGDSMTYTLPPVKALASAYAQIVKGTTNLDQYSKYYDLVKFTQSANGKYFFVISDTDIVFKTKPIYVESDGANLDFGTVSFAAKKTKLKKDDRQPDMMNSYEDSVIDYIESIGEMDRSDAQGVALANKSVISHGYELNKPAKETARTLLGIKIAKDKKTPAKKAEAKKESSSKKATDYDCDELIKEAKERKAKQKLSAAKTEKKPAITKNIQAVEKAVERAEKQFKEGDLTKAQIIKMIAELQAKIKDLEKLLKTAK